MNPAKINALLETLQAACSRQFRFNPRRVAANMRYKGSEGHGASVIHLFRDSHSHSIIELKSTVATLRESAEKIHGTHHEKAHWTPAEKARYQHSDAEIDAELAQKQATLEYTQASALYQDHRQHLLSHYPNWPGHQAGGVTAREAARTLIAALNAANDARLADFAKHLQTSDSEELAHLLLAPCHLEIEQCVAARN